MSSLPPAIILAGGLSRRMGGGDKGLLELGGKPIVEHVIDRLQPQCGALALNVNGDPERFGGFSLPVRPDSVADFPGPLAGVLAGMDWAADLGAQWLISMAADTPFFPDDLVISLRAAQTAAETPLVMAASAKPEGSPDLHPTIGLWRTDLREDLRASLQNGIRKVLDWTEPRGCARAIFHDRAPDPFFNINTPEDLMKAERLLSEMIR